jgi:hypothetical protein
VRIKKALITRKFSSFLGNACSIITKWYSYRDIILICQKGITEQAERSVQYMTDISTCNIAVLIIPDAGSALGVL